MINNYGGFEMTRIKSKLINFFMKDRSNRCFVEREDGIYYYHQDGKLAKGYTIIKKKKYNFDEYTGRMLVGLHNISNGGTYYFLEDGDVYKDGLKVIDGKKYYFSRATGNMQVGIRTLDDEGTKYYFLEEGDIFRGKLDIIERSIPCLRDSEDYFIMILVQRIKNYVILMSWEELREQKKQRINNDIKGLGSISLFF